MQSVQSPPGLPHTSLSTSPAVPASVHTIALPLALTAMNERSTRSVDQSCTRIAPPPLSRIVLDSTRVVAVQARRIAPPALPAVLRANVQPRTSASETPLKLSAPPRPLAELPVNVQSWNSGV